VPVEIPFQFYSGLVRFETKLALPELKRAITVSFLIVLFIKLIPVGDNSIDSNFTH